MPPKPVKGFPPPNWPLLLKKLKAYRKELHPVVDTINVDSVWHRTGGDVEARRYHMLTALMLSALARDTTVVPVMDQWIKDGLSPSSVKKMHPATLNQRLKSVTFHNVKTKRIKQVADIILKDYGGVVPSEYEQLIALPGVGPKMAHLFLQAAHGKVEGIGVDTHVHRISKRFHWAPPSCKIPDDTRKYLESWLPKEEWQGINLQLVGLGQTVCPARNPKCESCKLNQLCPSAFKESKRIAPKKRK